jgi:general stress protein 26
MNDWSREESLQFLQEKIKHVRTGMLTTYSDKGFHSRPMGTADVDAEGNVWFFTNEYSEKANEISADNAVSVTYADPHHHTFISIRGKGELVDDKTKIKELWNPFVQAFFPKGVDDPKLTLLKITPADVEYWDSSSSSMVVLFNMLKAVVTGTQYDEGKHGKIDL